MTHEGSVHCHTPAQTAKLKYDIECLDRSIQTLQETLEKSLDKRDKMHREMENGCEHKWKLTGKEWEPSFDNCEISMDQVVCERCGKASWNIRKDM